VKIILSRKGFDSSAGGVPSPIFPDGAMYSLPIPETGHGGRCTRYADITWNGQTIGGLVSDLTGGNYTGKHCAHLDPDLRAESIPREEGWKPVFGQDGAAERHLQRYGVGPGDLFLYFGWFRRVEQVGGRYRYVRGAPDLHVIFGWLQVERRICSNDKTALPNWAASHPHYMGAKSGTLDSIYTSTEILRLPTLSGAVAGGGVFTKFDPRLCLTQQGKTRSLWQLPFWFDPEGKGSALSYHGNRARWTRCDGYVTLQSVGRGQEFVLSCYEYPEAIAWLAALFNLNSVGGSMMVSGSTARLLVSEEGQNGERNVW